MNYKTFKYILSLSPVPFYNETPNKYREDKLREKYKEYLDRGCSIYSLFRDDVHDKRLSETFHKQTIKNFFDNLKIKDFMTKEYQNFIDENY